MPVSDNDSDSVNMGPMTPHLIIPSLSVLLSVKGAGRIWEKYREIERGN